MSESPSEARILRLAVIGLGYDGLPLVFAAPFPVTAYDVKSARIEPMKKRRDNTLEVTEEELAAAVHLTLTDREADLGGSELFIVTMPTPID